MVLSAVGINSSSCRARGQRGKGGSQCQVSAQTTILDEPLCMFVSLGQMNQSPPPSRICIVYNTLIGRLSSFTHLLGREALFLVVLGRGLRLMRMTPWGGTNAAVVVAPVRVLVVPCCCLALGRVMPRKAPFGSHVFPNILHMKLHPETSLTSGSVSHRHILPEPTSSDWVSRPSFGGFVLRCGLIHN